MKNDLKNELKNHLVDEAETERLKRVEANSKLNKVTFINNGAPMCDTE